MLHAGLDLSRRKLDVCLLNERGEHLDQLAVPPDADALRRLAGRIAETYAEPVCAVVESMTGARLVHDTLEACGWAVEIADAQKVKGLAPLACKTDRIDSQVLATLSHRDLVPAIWLPDPRVREERELARFRLHLVKHNSALKNRIHSTLINFGRACPVTDLFGAEGRKLLEKLEVPEPWRSNVVASLSLIDDLERQIAEVNRRLKESHADHPLHPLADERPGDRLGVGVYDRRRDRRDRAVSKPAEARWLHGPLPAGEPVRRRRSPRPVDQARADLPALGAARGDDARAPPPRLLGALPAKQEEARQAAWRQGRPDRHRPPVSPRDLAHADSQPVLRSERRRSSSGGLTALLDLRPRANDPISPDPPDEEAIET
jgi:Transposase